MNNCISKFIERFKPGDNLQKPDEEILNFGRQMLPIYKSKKFDRISDS